MYLKTLTNKYIFILIILSQIIYSDNFEFNTLKKDVSGKTVSNGLKVGDTKTIIVTGYGINKRQALDNALKSAVEQAIGVLIDTETMLKNDKIIKDNILTSSSGYVKSYKEISFNKSNSLIELKIKAIVKSQKIFRTIKKLNISTISISNTKDIYARVSTKNRSKKSAEKIFKKALTEYISTETMRDILSVKIVDAKVLEDKMKNNKVPIRIKYKVLVDYDIYKQKIKKIEQTFENLGGVLHKRVDLPKIKKYGKDNKSLAIRVTNKNKMNNLFKNEVVFLIMKRYGEGYRVDAWEFPKEWKDNYPFHGNEGKYKPFDESFQLILEISDKSNHIILADKIDTRYKYTMLYDYSGDYQDYFSCDSYGNRSKMLLISPTFSNNDTVYEAIKYIDLKDIDKVKNIILELEEI